MKVKLVCGEQARAFELKRQGDVLTVVGEDGVAHTVQRLSHSGPCLEVLIQGRRVRVCGAPNAGHKHLWVEGRHLRYEPLKEGAVHHAPDPGSLAVSIPAVITEVLVQPGDRVKMGDKLVLLESMKMVLSVQAPYAGVVKAVHARKGQSVEPGAALVEVEPDAPGAAG